MSTTGTTASRGPTTSVCTASGLAASTTFRTFAAEIAIAAPVIYLICELRNWPMFTYHPGTKRIEWFSAAARRDEGPAMHWYGWSANTLIGSAMLGCIAA
jgi:hypothetical protein